MGVVARVSGPVVTAEGLEGAKMYDVVRVGELGLVGEVIRLEGTRATIQVYEDTTGLRPGDKVENTGQALSVELGPGLLKSIYDGVQRPLEQLKKNLGDFITRGFVAAPLDEKAQWEFTATAKPGTEVSSGAILGTVQETPLILHKIMVPPGVKGTLAKLSSGSYTIRDPIGSIQTAAGPLPVYLAQKWVVRVPRPVAQKLAPTIPLLTGQRVIDTMFPIAKGGTAAIPGPFGSGKCCGGETPVQLADGTVVRLDQLYELARREGACTLDGNDEWYRLREPIELLSMVDGRLVRSSTRTVYKGKSDTMVRIRTRSGRTVRVTPVHRLFTVGPDGALRAQEAGELTPGDYAASVRKLPHSAGAERLGWTSPRLLRPGKGARVPEVMTRDLAEWLGLFVAEGQIRGHGSVLFTHPDGELLHRFRDLTSSLFGIEGRVEPPPSRTPHVLVRSRLLVELLGQLGTAAGSSGARIPASVLRSGDHELGGFLLGYYLGVGGFRPGEVEFRPASKTLQTELVYALTRLGITSSMAMQRVDGVPHYRVLVRGSPELSKLESSVRSEWPQVAAVSRYLRSAPSTPSSADRVPLAAEHPEGTYRAPFGQEPLLEHGIGLADGLGSGGGRGATTYSPVLGSPRIDPTLSRSTSEPWASRGAGLGEWIYRDEIVEVAVEKDGPFDVFDVSVPEFGENFVGGDGGMLLHNTVTQQQLAKWADSDVVVYVGCGERGNEMTEVLATFPNLQDPKSKRPLMERTILIANTSNMPVAAREASVYTGITIAEYYRDMGYDVALMADSTSRWAEAMREISGRLEEMPGEEGYPAYLGRRIAEFYERAGRVVTLSPEGRTGSVSVVGAVSPPGGDFSEPVSQNTLRVTRVFWALDASLASRRHFPSSNWLQSYSLYAGDLEAWYRSEIAPDWMGLRQKAVETLQKEAELQEIVQLVGVDALPEREKAILDVSRMIREDYLQQSAYDDVDTYTSIRKQYRMLRAILTFGEKEQEAIAKGATLQQLQKLPVRQKLSRMKWIPEADLATSFDALEAEMNQAVAGLAAGSS